MTYANEQEFIKLADELAEIPASDDNWTKIQEIIRNLHTNEYHDFASNKFALPKMQMIVDFAEINREDIVNRIKNGDFDQ